MVRTLTQLPAADVASNPGGQAIRDRIASPSTSWVDAIDLAMREGGLDVDDLRVGFGASRFSISRWIEGLDEPHPLALPSALKSLASLVEAKLR